MCGACGVRVMRGALAEPDAEESRGLSRAGTGVRLACRARVDSAVAVRPLALTIEPTLAAAGSQTCGTLVLGVDLGTTSVAAVLIDSSTGIELGRVSAPNLQQSFGADVVSRMSAALSGKAPELRALAEASVAEAIQKVISATGCDASGVERVVIAGNSVMAALFTGTDVGSLAQHPFELPHVPRTIDPSAAHRLGLSETTDAAIVRSIAGFVGGDALAAVVACGMIEPDQPMLLVDLGTNAEIVLGVGGSGLVVSSAAAGPAFEGMGIACGGPAVTGAVCEVRIKADGSVVFDVIGESAPLWFTGSGLVSAIAELRRVGHIDPSGLMQETGPLGDRFRRDDAGVLEVNLGGADGCLSISQLDVRALQLAKSAVRAGIERVAAASDVSMDAIQRVLVAGAFGSAMAPKDLVYLGVIPHALEDRVTHVGNAALEGSALMALDPTVTALANEAARTARHVDLALDPQFNRALLEGTELTAR